MSEERCPQCGSPYRDKRFIVRFGRQCGSDWHDFPAPAVEALAPLESLIPDTFYADRSLSFRISRLVSEWQKAVRLNQELEAKLDESAPSPAPRSEDEERKAFEAKFGGELGNDLRREPKATGIYWNPQVQIAWDGWLARAREGSKS